MRNPLVSTIIPAYNSELFLADAVESIRQQAYDPMEIIIVDDGSTDKTREIANSFKGTVRYIYQENSGPASAHNAGLRMADGDLIAFLDADDLWAQNRLGPQIARLESDRSVDIVLGLTQRMYLKRLLDSKFVFEASSIPWVALTFGSAIFRRHVFERIGFFDETMMFGEDVDWFMRAREQGIRMIFLKQVTLFYRVHRDNLTNDSVTRDRYFMKAIKKSLDRRRQRDGSVSAFPKIHELDDIAKELHDTGN
jgi:glycosyltransferase involved in cell wall biosynthesis